LSKISKGEFLKIQETRLYQFGLLFCFGCVTL
jgi:hypothetical protein